MTDQPIHTRCSGTTACLEVVARLEAADRSRLEGFAEVAADLRQSAARWALIHGFGARPENRPLSGPVSPADDRPRTQGADDPDR